MDWWQSLIIAVACGAFGGLANVLLNGGERYRVPLPFRAHHEVQLGFLGAVFLGVAAAVVSWAGALYDVEIHRMIFGCALAGVGGSYVLTSQAKAQGYQASSRNSADAAERVAGVAEASMTQAQIVESATAGVARGVVESVANLGEEKSGTELREQDGG